MGLSRAAWFVIGLVFISLLAMHYPKVAGGLVILIALYLAFALAKKGTLK